MRFDGPSLWAAPPILVFALLGGMALRAGRLELLGFVIQPSVLISIFVFNVIALGYRLLATIDAWRLATYANAWATQRRRAPRAAADALLGRSPSPDWPRSASS